MKKVFLLFMLLCQLHSIVGQRMDIPSGNVYNESTSKKVFIGPSFGTNNPTGLIGFKADFRIKDHWLLGGGAGLGGWGYKLGFTAQYLFKKEMRGFGLGTGLTYTTGGANDLKITENKPSGYSQEVSIKQKPCSTILLTGSNYFKMGKKNRFYLQYGFSIALNRDQFDVYSNTTIEDETQAIINILSPGGILFGFGFLFGVGQQ